MCPARRLVPKENTVTDSVSWSLGDAVTTITLNRPQARIAPYSAAHRLAESLENEARCRPSWARPPITGPLRLPSPARNGPRSRAADCRGPGTQRTGGTDVPDAAPPPRVPGPTLDNRTRPRPRCEQSDPASISAHRHTSCSAVSSRSLGTRCSLPPSGVRHQIPEWRHHTVRPHRTESTDISSAGSWTRRRPPPSPRSVSIPSRARAVRPAPNRHCRSGAGTQLAGTGWPNHTAFPGSFQSPNRDRVRWWPHRPPDSPATTWSPRPLTESSSALPGTGAAPFFQPHSESKTLQTSSQWLTAGRR